MVITDQARHLVRRPGRKGCHMFSVVIPACNCEQTIGRVLDSVKNQTRFDLIKEIIVINDGSSDRTGRIISAYISSHPWMPFIYLKHRRHGVSYTRNRGIRAASAEWIALLDADDIWMEQKLERQAQVLKDNPHICFLGAQAPLKSFLRKRYGLCKMTARDICIRSCPPTPSVVFRKTAGEKLGLFDEHRQYGEDGQFFQRFLLYDSYYILAEDLVRISIQKRYFGERGLTSHMKKCCEGRERNIRELYKLGLISRNYMIWMLLFSRIKYVRRRLIYFMDICRVKVTG